MPARLVTATASRVGVVLLASSLVALGLTGVLASRLPSMAAEIDPIPASGNVTVAGHGNGHGHGLSQYGAQGAALKGLSAASIVGFYYHNTTLVNLGPSTIRVSLSNAGTTTVSGATTISSGGSSRPLSSATRYRLVPSGGGFQLQYLSGTTWGALSPGLGAQADFASTSGQVRVYLSDGSTGDYRGSVGGLRSGSGQLTINRVSLDGYVQGVVPRESPSYWAAAALQAQAIAARSYAREEAVQFERQSYDICDSDQCQVYGGIARNASDGTRLYGEEASTNAAVSATSNQVLQYNHTTIFAQYSASDGGWTVDGGQPYLTAQADPYDDAASGDPYLSWTRTVSVSSLAGYYGLRRVTQIEITARDGHGQWGGRVLSGFVDGIDSSGASQHIATSGFGLQSAMGLPHNWFLIQSPVVLDTRGATVISSTPTTVDAFYRGATNQLEGRHSVNGQGWQAVVNLGAPASGAITGDPDAATWGGGHLDVAVRDSSGHLAIRTYGPSGGWLPWVTHTPIIGSSPAIVDPVVNEGDVFYLGVAYTIWTTEWTQAAGWNQPYKIPGVNNASSGPDATALVPGARNMTVVYRALDQHLWTVEFDPARGWRPPTMVNPTYPMPSPVAQLDPSVGGMGTGNPSFYYTAVNGVIYHSGVDVKTGNWTPWYAVPGAGTITGSPDVSYLGVTHGDVISGMNGAIVTEAWNKSSGWANAWTRLN